MRRKSAVGYSGLDPMEDTESQQSAPAGVGHASYSGLDPMEDTESDRRMPGGAGQRRVTVGSIRWRILKDDNHRRGAVRSAGYSGLDPMEDTERGSTSRVSRIRL